MAIHIRRRELIVTLGGAAAWPLAARAQQTAKPVIGLLINSEKPQSYMAGFHAGLRETGFVEVLRTRTIRPIVCRHWHRSLFASRSR
jgi:putative ABC transport system substrate-binding protein